MVILRLVPSGFIRFIRHTRNYHGPVLERTAISSTWKFHEIEIFVLAW